MVSQQDAGSDYAPPPGPPPQRQPAAAEQGFESSDNGWEHVGSQRPIEANFSGVQRSEVPLALRPGEAPAVIATSDDEDNIWAEARRQPTYVDHLDKVPDALRPGAKRDNTNPFLRKTLPKVSPAPPAITLQTPNASFSKLHLDDPSGVNPWRPEMEAQPTQVEAKQEPVAYTEVENTDHPWSTPTPEPPSKEPVAPKSPALVSLHSEEESTWGDEPKIHAGSKISPLQMGSMADELLREQDGWNEGSQDLDKGKTKAVELPVVPAPPLDDWSLIDSDPTAAATKTVLPIKAMGDEPVPVEQKPLATVTEEKPPLPARPTGEQARWISSRLPVDGKFETYQIKNIHWYDSSCSDNPRVSPILIQNENGPCPLVALVNALTMTTPAHMNDTALVQVLRSREQVSLNLVLDAVFDELMRRSTSDVSLPDVSDLYAFMQSLHTGMNVNPRFVPSSEVVNAFKHTSLTHLGPEERTKFIPGTFENTLEMKLYATFSIPLIHGWLPSKDEPVYDALERHAASYEDVQNLLFREEELEDKLFNTPSGLTESEQELYQDIMTIKMFLNSSATQLTHWGIGVIGKAIRPGTFAILFRNDHFSTLYCHPETRQLYTLVTDAGYKTHDEIVWESLLDVNGERNELLSGDFRVTREGNVGGASSAAGPSDDGAAWKTVSSKRGKTRAEDEAPLSPSTEQEDRDLALAMQLQEEEDQRHREDQARRQRESVLSQQYIEQQGRQPNPVNRGTGAGIAPQRRSSNTVNPPATTTTGAQPPRQPPRPQPQGQQVRSLVPPVRPGVNRPVNHDDEPPPPSYEQAAQAPVYDPLVGHPSHPQSSPAASRTTSRTSVNTMGPSSRVQRPTGSYPARRQQVPVSGASGGSQSRGDRDCVVM